MSWLTRDTAEPTAESLIGTLRAAAVSQHEKGYPEYVEHEHVARAVGARLLACRQIQQMWFYAGVGVSWGLDAKETLYLSKCPYSYVFADQNLVPWTNWVGSLHVSVMEHVRRGTFPKELHYGPPLFPGVKPVGPVVNFAIKDGVLKSHEFYDHDSQSLFKVSKPSARHESGLKDIVATIDVAQDKTIRSALSGTFIVHGGPGTGKTTAALHRVPYLINEQNAHGGRGKDHYASNENRFFSQETTIVVVWKEHLVPHLERCLSDLGFDKVRVQHIETWVADCVRPHVSFGFGPKNVELIHDPADIADLKLCVHEDGLEDYLLGPHPGLDRLRERYEKVRATVNNYLANARVKPIAGVPPARFTVDEVLAAYKPFAPQILQAIRRLEAVAKAFNPRLLDEREREYITDPVARKEEALRRTAVRDAIASGEKLMTKVAGSERELIRMVRSSLFPLLMGFYASSQCRTDVEERFGADGDAKLQEYTRHQRKERKLSRPDRYLLLWIIRILARYDSVAAKEGWKALPSYSHVVVDEAQYYRPLLLRLLHSVTMAPHHSMTIAGDLEQRISQVEGLMAWDEAGIAIPAENYKKLETNYRWSRAIYEFLLKFRQAARLNDPLRAPDEWYSGDGVPPAIACYSSRDEESSSLVQKVAELKSRQDSREWTIAIVLPTREQDAIAKTLQHRLESCDIKSQWVVGVNLRESRDHVVMTSYDDIVGLEFDAVFLACADELINELSEEEALRAVWVAITRARKYEHISYVGSAKVFERPQLAEYR